MDTVSNLPDVATGVGAGAGALGLLAWLVTRVMGQASNDRKEYQESLAEERKSHSKEVAELKSEIRQLKEDVQFSQEQFEEERRLRRRVEDEADHLRRMAGLTDYGRNAQT